MTAKRPPDELRTSMPSAADKPLLVHATLTPAPESSEGAIDLLDMLKFLRQHALRMLLTGLVAAGVSFSVSYAFPKIYRAEATVVPVSARGSAAGLGLLSSQLGGVAGLLGLELGGDNSTAVSLAQLQSRKLIMLFIQERNLLPLLFPDRWDDREGAWSVQAEKVPTLQDGYMRFSREILSVREDRKNGLVTVAVQWRDPAVAASWANEIIARANAFAANQAAAEAERNLKYLNDELGNANEVELRQTIYALIETEIKKRMLARTQRDYAFRVLDPAVPPLPKRYVKPQRVLFVFGGFLVGTFLGFLWSLLLGERRALTRSTG